MEGRQCNRPATTPCLGDNFGSEEMLYLKWLYSLPRKGGAAFSSNQIASGFFHYDTRQNYHPEHLNVPHPLLSLYRSSPIIPNALYLSRSPVPPPSSPSIRQPCFHPSLPPLFSLFVFLLYIIHFIVHCMHSSSSLPSLGGCVQP